MNRLIIIGNGFDLAHDLKTSFNDFIADYYNSAIESFRRNHAYEDKLLKIEYAHNDSSSMFMRINPSSVLPKVLEDLKRYSAVDITVRSEILSRVNSSIETKNWVDIETEYFNALKDSRDEKRGGDVKNLNEEFDYLKEKLIEYLKLQQPEDFKRIFDLQPMLDCFTQKILGQDFVRHPSDEEVEYIYFLNFNYTNTLLPYFYECQKAYKAEINHIHGSLDNIYGNPVFGFGDELDKRFLEFEDLNDNEYYKHIKSFEYFKNRNYFNLLRFIDTHNFQVHVYGHSCGLSDRTLLNSIFEHERCKSIKIFYYEKNEMENDFVEKTHEIYRHFKNKGDMRTKIVPLERCEAMPQPEKVMEFK